MTAMMVAGGGIMLSHLVSLPVAGFLVIPCIDYIEALTVDSHRWMDGGPWIRLSLGPP